MHSARATLRNAAAIFGARHAQHFAQSPQQGHVGFNVQGMVLAVDIEFYHGVYPSQKSRKSGVKSLTIRYTSTLFDMPIVSTL